MGLPEVSITWSRLVRIGSYICYHLSHHRPRVVAHIATISLGVALNTTRRRRVDIPKVR
jgi:hypothetical protein